MWYKNHEKDGQGKVSPHLLEEVYNLEDALVVAGFRHSFVRYADVVKIANIAQIVNVLAPIQACGDDMLIQSIFYPFEMFSKRRNGAALRLTVDGPSYEGATNGCVHYIDASAILDGSRLHVFLTNRAMDENAEVCVTIADKTVVSCESAEILTGPDAKAVNSLEDGEIVVAKPFDAIDMKDGQAHCKIPALSFVAMTLNLGGTMLDKTPGIPASGLWTGRFSCHCSKPYTPYASIRVVRCQPPLGRNRTDSGSKTPVASKAGSK